MRPPRFAWIVIPFLFSCTTSVDLDTERQLLLDTDRAWAQATASGADASEIVAHWSADARVMLSGLEEIVGSEALRTMVEANEQIPGFAVSWEPEEAVVFDSGAYGYTRGTNAFTFPDPDGNLVTTRGRYLTLWRKDADGRWRCFLEMTNEGAPPGAAQP